MKQAIDETKLEVKPKYNYANMITLMNLSMGCFSLLCVFGNEYTLAAGFILLGTLLDRLDGKVARKLDIVSELGKELDSLADLVSFGVAPAILMWSLSLNGIYMYGSAITIIYILSGAYRLARFNVTKTVNYYIGVPITIAGGIMAVAALLSIRHNVSPYLTALLTLSLSYTMVTTNIKVLKR
ncbi:MAG: CDP-diacylglycerol--serine O-phosphatidyltransferase [Clostridiales bacterium]|nr:CDP-diacylglycerol--serine O-phosphatidyltransferase [Clostridiales bacterium]